MRTKSKIYAAVRRSYRNQPKENGKREVVRRLRANAPSVPRRLWTMECSGMGFPFSAVTSSKRSTLARLHFHKKLHWPIVLV